LKELTAPTKVAPPLKFKTFDWKTNPNAVEEMVAEQLLEAQTILPNPADATKALELTAIAMRRIATELAEYDLKQGYCKVCKRSGMSAESLAKTLSYAAKTVDETTRLLEFSKGNADSRSEVVGLSDLLKYLTDEQFSQVRLWVAASMK